MELAIEADGSLAKWKKELDFSEFVEDGKKPQPVATNRWHKAERAYYDVMQLRLDKEEMIWLLQRLLTKYSLSTKQVVEKKSDRGQGLFDFLFKSKEEREKEKRVKDVLERTDDFIERTEKMLDEMKKDDERWQKGL